MIQEQFLLHRNLFNLTVSLNSETSERLGHPVVSMDYWGQSYLCDSQWSQNEAKVMCRELGFATGAKFYKSKISQKISQSFSPNLGKFQCLGNEATLSECKRSMLEQTCDFNEDLSLLLCDVGGLNGIHRKTKVRGYPFTLGPSSELYFCSKNFGNKEASVFCRMLGWNHGRSLGSHTNDINIKSKDIMSLSCQGTKKNRMRFMHIILFCN